MGKRKYSLSGNEEILISWQSGWKSTQVFFNNEHAGDFSKEQLDKGDKITLPNGKELELYLDKGIFTTLISKIDGEHIPNSMGDPKYQLRQTFYILFLIGLYNLLIGYIFSFKVDSANLFDIGIIHIVTGVLQIASGFGVQKGSRFCTIIAYIIFIADIVQSILFFKFTGMKMSILIKIFMFLFSLKGFKYTKKIN